MANGTMRVRRQWALGVVELLGEGSQQEGQSQSGQSATQWALILLAPTLKYSNLCLWP